MPAFFSRCVLLMSLAPTVGCGSDARSQNPGASAGTPFCPDAAHVTQAVGFAVRDLPAGTRSHGEAQMCAYQSTDASQGAFVSISVQPADPQNDRVAELRSSAKLLAGADAEPIQVGEGGYAYGSGSKSEAAARQGGRVFHVEAMSTGESIGNKRDAVVALLEGLVK